MTVSLYRNHAGRLSAPTRETLVGIWAGLPGRIEALHTQVGLPSQYPIDHVSSMLGFMRAIGVLSSRCGTPTNPVGTNRVKAQKRHALPLQYPDDIVTEIPAHFVWS